MSAPLVLDLPPSAAGDVADDRPAAREEQLHDLVDQDFELPLRRRHRVIDLHVLLPRLDLDRVVDVDAGNGISKVRPEIVPCSRYGCTTIGICLPVTLLTYA
jgi:hypothetical protein